MAQQRGAARAEDAQGTPTQSHISPRILVYEDSRLGGQGLGRRGLRASGLGYLPVHLHVLAWFRLQGLGVRVYRGTSLIRNSTALGPYSRAVPGPGGGGLLFISEVPL